MFWISDIARRVSLLNKDLTPFAWLLIYFLELFVPNAPVRNNQSILGDEDWLFRYAKLQGDGVVQMLPIHSHRSQQHFVLSANKISYSCIRIGAEFRMRLRSCLGINASSLLTPLCNQQLDHF